MPQFWPRLPYLIGTNTKFLRCLIIYLTFSLAFPSLQPRAADSGGLTIGNWRLLRAANPKGGPDAVSMSRTADMTRSDLDLAGMMLKCSEHGAQIVIVALTPLPPRSRPEVTISALGKEWRFAASVVPPGAEVLLPPEAINLAAGPWQSAHELAVHVKSQEQSFAGIIPIDGLAAAFTTLLANCPAG